MTVSTKTCLLATTLLLFFFSCKDDDSTLPDQCFPELVNCPKSIIDGRDGKEYPIVKIGCQCWMAKNLNYEESGICYDDSLGYCDELGRLYNFEELLNGEEQGNLKTIQGICPDGWHLPSSWELRELVDSLGGETKAGQVLKKDELWRGDCPVEESSGFDLLPAGIWQPNSLTNGFSGIESSAYIASATVIDESFRIWILETHWCSEEAKVKKFSFRDDFTDRAMSCRCIKDIE